jgi:hypothetical protein
LVPAPDTSTTSRDLPLTDKFPQWRPGGHPDAQRTLP